ncbi:MAG: trigger factor, partial [Gammaproteobacteria bacterium]
AKLDGFRPGKIPMSVIKKRFGEYAKAEVMNELVQSSYGEAIQQEKLYPVGMPQIEPKEIEESKELEYIATFEVFPEFDVQGFDKIKVVKPKVEIAEVDIEKVVENLRKQKADWSDVERAAADGDKLVIDFKGTIGGEEFQGGSAEDFEMIMGEKSMLEDFEKGLEGAKAGEEKTVEVNFPEDYPSADTAGKTASFAITVKKVQESTLPEVNEEFVESLGLKDKTIEDFREEVKTNLQRECDQAILSRVKAQVLKGLEEQNKIELPKALLDQEIDQLKKQAEQHGQHDVDGEKVETDARTRVTLSLVISEIVKENEIKLDQSRVQKMLFNVASSYGDPSMIMSYYENNPEMMKNFEAAVLEEQVVEWVAEKSDLEEKEMSFEELSKAPVA